MNTYFLAILILAQSLTFDLITTKVTIIQMTEEELHKTREEALLGLDSTRLDRGSWSEEELRSFAKWDYDEYKNYLAKVKNKVLKLGYSQVEISNDSSAKKSDLSIRLSFSGYASKRGNIGLFSMLNLYEKDKVLVSESNWSDVKKMLRKRIKK